MKISRTQLVLTILYVVTLITSNLISAQLIVTPFTNSSFFGSMTSAIIIFPITCILSDVFSEVYGYAWSRWTCYVGFGFNLFTNMILTLVTAFNITGDTAGAFKELFGITSGMGWCVLAASFIAYMVGDFVNDKIFARIKDKYHANDNKKFGFRAVLSTLCGQTFDSCIYLPLALVVLPKLFLGFSYVTVPTVLGMCLMQIIIKVSYEFLTLPLTDTVVRKVAKHEQVSSI